MENKDLMKLIKKAVCKLPEDEQTEIQDICTFEEENNHGEGLRVYLMDGRRLNLVLEED